MKGKYSVRAENRRANELSAQISALRETLSSEREEANRRIGALEAEVRRLHTEHLAEASKLAENEIARRTAEVGEERRRRELAEDTLKRFVIRTDVFIMQACRYVSMTTGMHALDAIGMVSTWATNKDFYGVTDTKTFLAELGVPEDGWVATTWLKVDTRRERRTAKVRLAHARPEAVTLDRAESEGNERIHPDYDPTWYDAVVWVDRRAKRLDRETPRVSTMKTLKEWKKSR